MTRTPLLSIAAIVVMASALAAGTTRSAPPEPMHAVRLSFTTQEGGRVRLHVAADDGSAPRRIVVRGGRDVLEITRAQIVLSDIALAGSGTLQRAPMLIDLPLGVSSRSAVTVQVPSGTYPALEARLEPVASGTEATTVLLANHPELRGASVRVEGRFRGKPFVYHGAPRAGLDMEFNPPVLVDESGASLTVNVDLAGWFRTLSGALIDPTTANAGGRNADAVARNIERSFDVFAD